MDGDCSQAGCLYAEYQRKRAALFQIAQQQYKLVLQLSDDGHSEKEEIFCDRLKQFMDRLEFGKFQVLVMGRLTSGKTSLINALLGEKLSPVSPRPLSGPMCQIKYAEESEKRATLYPKDGSSPFDITIEELGDYLIMNRYEEDVADRFNKVEIHWPTTFCKNGVEIIDLKGFGFCDDRYEVIFEYAKTVDAILYIMKAIDACTRKDMDALGALNALGFEAPFVIITCFDDIKQSVQLGEITEEQFRSYIEKALGKLVNFKDAGIMYVDSRSGLLGKLNGDSALVEESGINAVEASLEQYLVEKKGQAKLLVSLRALRAVNREARQIISERISMLVTSREGLQQHYAAVQNELQILESTRQFMVGRTKTTLHDIARDAFDLADAYFLDLPGKLEEWADNFEITSSIGFPPRKSTLSKVVEEVAGHLHLKIQENAGLWNKETLSPMIEKRVAGLIDSMEDEARAFLRSADAISVSVDMGEVMINIVATYILVLFNMLNPVATLAAISAIAGGGILNALSLKKIIKKKVVKELGDHLRDERKNLAEKIECRILAELEIFSQAIDEDLGNEINKVKKQVEVVLSEKQESERNVKEQIEMLLSLQKKNDDIDTFLEEMFTEIGLGALPQIEWVS